MPSADLSFLNIFSFFSTFPLLTQHKILHTRINLLTLIVGRNFSRRLLEDEEAGVCGLENFSHFSGKHSNEEMTIIPDKRINNYNISIHLFEARKQITRSNYGKIHLSSRYRSSFADCRYYELVQYIPY